MPPVLIASPVLPKGAHDYNGMGSGISKRFRTANALVRIGRKSAYHCKDTFLGILRGPAMLTAVAKMPQGRSMMPILLSWGPPPPQRDPADPSPQGKAIVSQCRPLGKPMEDPQS